MMGIKQIIWNGKSRGIALKAEKKTPRYPAPHRTELIVPDGDGYRRYDLQKMTPSQTQITNEQYNQSCYR